MQSQTMPVDAVRTTVVEAKDRGAVVLIAPTGSGKSTQVPRWLQNRGRVLVVEPRRVACRALAQWVARLEGTALGRRVGYAIRDEERRSTETMVLFVTPGVALRLLVQDPRLDAFTTIILDEFHERGWQVDLLLALLAHRRRRDLVVMSATIDPIPLKNFLNAAVVEANGKQFSVDIAYARQDTRQPSAHELETRVVEHLKTVVTAGDILVFLPGKAEITTVQRSIVASLGEHYHLAQLHSGLSMKAQSEVFQKTRKPKIILATNIAETSLTLEGVTHVVDSGLVRQTQFFQGRGFLGLVAIAQDSADQRSGRAGRLQSGSCFRLWGRGARLDAETNPEILREGLGPMLLALLECGAKTDSLSFLTTPKAHAFESAYQDLSALGAVTDSGELTDTGRALARMPLDPHLGRLVIEARRASCLGPMLVLVAALAQQRTVHLVSENHPADSDECEGCDVWRLLSAYFEIDEDLRLDRETKRSISSVVHRLSKALDEPLATTVTLADRLAIAQAAVRADRRFVFLSRTRRKDLYWTNGGREASLSNRSALQACLTRGLKTPAAIVAFEIFGLAIGPRKHKLQLSWLMPIDISMVEALVEKESRLTEVRIGKAGLEGYYAEEHAKRALNGAWSVLADADLQEGMLMGLKQGSVWPNTAKVVKHRLSLNARSAFLNETYRQELTVDFEEYVRNWMDQIGLRSAEDILLLEPSDLLPPLPDEFTVEMVLKRLPDEVHIGSRPARLTYDLSKKTAILSMDKRWVKAKVDPRFLPRVEGFRIVVKDGSRYRILRK